MDRPSILAGQASEFADGLSESIFKILGQEVLFEPIVDDDPDDPEAAVGTVSESTTPPGELGRRASAIPLFIGGTPRLNLMIQYQCCLDHTGEYLSVRRSEFHVFPYGAANTEPLFRLEYVRDLRSENVPASHLQIHAHRDEYTYYLICSERSKSTRPGRRNKTGQVPKIAEFHFPTGGHRFRPCLEDLLQSLIVEFDIDRNDQTWRQAVREGRENFRRVQLMASVRDRPQYAVRALKDLGYTVIDPDDGPLEEVSEKFTAY